MAQDLKSVQDFFSENFPSSSAYELAVFPSFPHLSFCLQRNLIAIGAQDCSSEVKGAFTGEVSAQSLKELGCRFVLVGHSERRQRFQENNSLLTEKLNRATEAGLTPVFCVGETLAQRESGEWKRVLENQLSILSSKYTSLVLAYEPVWAIGTGRVAEVRDIQSTHEWILGLTGGSWPLLYGGSVSPKNAKDILALSVVHGVLVGGASLQRSSFLEIAQSVT